VIDGVIDVIAQTKAVSSGCESGNTISSACWAPKYPREEMVSILERLGFAVENGHGRVPSWRADVEHYSVCRGGGTLLRL
jgi:hypothetical protein